MAQYDLSGKNGIGPATGDRLEIHHINVGCGDCTLLLIMNGAEVVRSVLIDSGIRYSNLHAYLSEKLSAYRHSEGRLIIDCLVTSHYHKDHLEGLLDIAGSVLIKSNIDVNYFREDNKVPDDNMTFPVSGYKAAGYNLAVIKMMYKITDNPGEYINILHSLLLRDNSFRVPVSWNNLPFGIILGTVKGSKILMDCVCGNGYVKGNVYGIKDRNGAPALPNNLNDISLAFSIHDEGDSFNYFTGGDLSGNKNIVQTSTARNIESAVAGSVSGVTVAKINHHGSRSSTNSDFLNMLTPDSAVICFPFYLSSCNLPTADVLSRLQDKVIKKACFTSRPYYRDRFSNIDRRCKEIQDDFNTLFTEFEALRGFLDNMLKSGYKLSAPDTIDIKGNLDGLLKDPVKTMLLNNINDKDRRVFENFLFYAGQAGDPRILDNEVKTSLETGSITDDLRKASQAGMSICRSISRSPLPLSDLQFTLAGGGAGGHRDDEEFGILSSFNHNMNQLNTLDDYLTNRDEGLYTAISFFKQSIIRDINNYLDLLHKQSIVGLTRVFTPSIGPDDPYYDYLEAITLVYPPTGTGRSSKLFQAGNLDCYDIQIRTGRKRKCPGGDSGRGKRAKKGQRE